jgi:CheY-like chemotaxis protein
MPRVSETKEEGKNQDAMGELNVLIVDDQKMNTKLLKRTLMNLGVNEDNIVCCYDGVEAVEIYEQRNMKELFDVVFMDHEMPRMTGSEATRELRGKGFEGRIVGVTGNAGTALEENFVSSGADEIIVKPLSKEAIEAVLNALIFLKMKD